MDGRFSFNPERRATVERRAALCETSAMTRTALSMAVVLAIVLGGITTAAKGPTVRLTVAGASFSAPLVVTTPEALATVYGGEFLGAPAAAPDAAWPRYVVSFYVDLPREMGVRRMYVVEYVRDPRSGGGYVYLPGRGHEAFALNRSTILRDGQDGRWHVASASWARALNAAIR